VDEPILEISYQLFMSSPLVDPIPNSAPVLYLLKLALVLLTGLNIPLTLVLSMLIEPVTKGSYVGGRFVISKTTQYVLFLNNE
jgi:hypothetical protein